MLLVCPACGPVEHEQAESRLAPRLQRTVTLRPGPVASRRQYRSTGFSRIIVCSRSLADARRLGLASVGGVDYTVSYSSQLYYPIKLEKTGKGGAVLVLHPVPHRACRDVLLSLALPYSTSHVARGQTGRHSPRPLMRVCARDCHLPYRTAAVAFDGRCGSSACASIASRRRSISSLIASASSR